jgi:GNAT superfamily N-acetyltransferase
VKPATRDVAVEVRPYREEDEASVLDLLRAALGPGPAGDRHPEFFRWKHEENPFGRSFMLVAEADHRIVGLRAFMRWRFEAAGRSVEAVRAVDTATHPEYQGLGVFSRLTKEALQRLREEVDLVFNTPNETSLRGYLKMGWRIVGQMPVWIRVRRPVRFVSRIRSLGETDGSTGIVPRNEAETAERALSDGAAVSSLLSSIDPAYRRYRTPHDVDYLRWRYGSAPFLDYRAVREYAGDELSGLAIFRVRPRGRLWETTIGELIVPAGDRSTLTRLLRRVAREAPVDHLTCRFPVGWSTPAVSFRSRLIRAPGGMTFVVNPLSERLDPDPNASRSWALSLGDLEVF